jgi:hypothetical protein
MTDFNPDSSLKLEGGSLTTPSGSGTDLIPTASTSLTQSKVYGERLPGAPKPPPDGSMRPTHALVTAKEIGRAAPFADDQCMALARQSYTTAEDYFNASHRTRLIDAMARFNSEHPKGSKYWSPSFEKRSRLFRPKTRAMTRKREAAACISLFGSADIVNVQAAASSDSGAVEDARIQEALLNYRLQEDDRWYRFVVGAVQDADRQGFVIGKTTWDYEEATRYYDEMHPELGPIKRTDMVATVDRPGWSLIPIERLRFSPASDWMDVVNSSPFLIEVIPMFVCDVRRYEANPRARLSYRRLTDGQLMSGGHSGEWDAIRMQRERNKVNRYERSSDPSDYAVCWVHRNIVRIEGEDYIFDTIGTTQMLSNIIPLSEFDPRGYRPYVIGSNMLESHNPFNVGATTLMSGIQDEINDVSNLSIDANKMATSGRMFIKRNTAIDLHALARFSPGAVVEMDNPQQDVKWDRSPEAPAGMQEEHQVLNTELDDLIGNFNQGSVANNRNLNETVGGMELLGTAADQMTEYDLHTLCTTFISKMLTQILDLEKRWETDANLATIIGQRLAASARKFWTALSTESKVIVNVGFGSTNPQKRMERIQSAMQTTMSMFPMTVYQSNQAEILKEVWAAAGFADASRFFPFLGDAGKPDPNPKVATLQQQLQSMLMKLYPGEMHNQGLIQREQVRSQAAERVTQMKLQGQIALQQAEAQAAFTIKKMELQMAYIELQMKHEQNDVARGQLMLNREKLSNDITVQRMELDLARQTAMVSPDPPMLAIDAEGQQQVGALNQPGSNIGPQPGFSADAASAADYLQAGKMPPPPVAQPLPGAVTPPLPNQPLVTASTDEQLGTPPQYRTNI